MTDITFIKDERIIIIPSYYWQLMGLELTCRDPCLFSVRTCDNKAPFGKEALLKSVRELP